MDRLPTPAPSPPGRKRLFVNSPPGFFPPSGPHKPFSRLFLPLPPVAPAVEACVLGPKSALWRDLRPPRGNHLYAMHMLLR